MRHVSKVKFHVYETRKAASEPDSHGQALLRQASVHSIIWPVNAILNDAYTVVESEVRIKAISDGYDPTIGIMYKGRDGWRCPAVC